MRGSLKCALVLAIHCALVTASSAAPTVAVMPFRDLSGGKGAVGEAIRETVTTDLKDVPGLTTIERGAIDKILAEQNLQASRAELDPQSTVRVGKLLGASLIVTGAYQKAGSSVRLTARFVKVETGEITGTAKVDGAEKDFLQLQDRITVELLRSAGMQKHVERFARRTRPQIKSLKTVELYGDAVAEPNEEKKVEYLKLALNEDPSFEYAARDLDALEKRLKAIDRIQKVAVDKKVEELRQQVTAEKDPEKRKQLEGQLAVQLMTTRRWHELRKLAKTTTVGSEGAAFFMVQSDSLLHDLDAVLRDGESFLQKYPASAYFPAVKSMMEQTISKKRKMEEGKTTVVPELAKIEGDQRWNLCRFGWVYRNHDQYKEARRFLRACLDVGTEGPKEVLPGLIQMDFELGDFAQARKDMADMEKAAPAEYRTWKAGYEMQLPADG